MKSFKSTAWILPQPVLIIGTYDKNGKPNAMNAAWGGQWDMHEIIISLGSHATTDNLAENPEFTVAFATKDTMIASSETGYYLVAEIVNILCDEKYLAEDDKPDVEKMELITFDPVHHTYIQLGKTVGNAFSDGKQLK